MANRENWSMTEWRNYYQSLYDDAASKYQETGIARYDSQAYKLDVIITAFNGYLAHKDERDTERTRRLRNIDAFVDRHVTDEAYTRTEVLDLIRQIKQF